MKQLSEENKQLLLKDLCARLPYRVRLHISSDLVDKDDTLLGISLTEGLTPYITHNKIISTHSGYLYSTEEVKPYLRPISSMTEKEKKEYELLCDYYMDDTEVKHYFNNIATIDWYHQNHFDCRGLIKLGLALEAPEGMYNIKEK